jgi:hypothetical protein
MSVLQWLTTPKSPIGDLKNALNVRAFPFRGQGQKKEYVSKQTLGKDSIITLPQKQMALRKQHEYK